MESLDQNVPARAVPLNEDEALLVRGLQLLTMKPMIYAANVAEADLADQGAGNAYVRALKHKASEENCEVIIVSAQARCSPGGHTPASCTCRERQGLSANVAELPVAAFVKHAGMRCASAIHAHVHSTAASCMVNDSMPFMV